jgi:hypothetical protein
MTIQDTAEGGPGDPGPLFTPGPRLGWAFRDRGELAVPYTEPEPDPRAIAARHASQAATASSTLASTWKWIGRPSLGLAVILGIVALAEKTAGGAGAIGPLAAIVVVCLPGLGWTAWCWLRRGRLHDASPEHYYGQAVAAWRQRAASWQAAEATRLASQPQWGSVFAPGLRTDVFGGTLAGWQGLLTVHGASLLAERPVLVADLSGQHAARQLMAAAAQSRVPAAGFRLPQDLGRSGLLSDLSPAQLATAIAEAIHAPGPGASSQSPAGPRSDRALDVRVLQQLAGALSARPVTPQRLAAAVRAALGNPDGMPDGILTDAEAERVAGSLFTAGYRDQVMASLTRLDAALAGLAAHAAEGWPTQAARLTCLVVDPAARSASGEVLTSLLVQWLTVQVTAAPAGQPVPAVILAGADEVARAHAERLADACELAGVPLTLLFRHLRGDAVSLLGGGTAAFMRLGNHAEAEHAATYTGRRHTFVMSSCTATRGGSLTTTHGTSDSCSTGESTGQARASGWAGRPDGGLLPGHAHSGSRTRTTGTTNSQTRGTSWSSADGTSFSDAAASQRVYEYSVEPTALQALPDHALLVVDRSAPGPRLRAIECDPDIISLPGATLAPLPPPSYAGAPQGLSPHVSPPGDPFGPATPPATLPRMPPQHPPAYPHQPPPPPGPPEEPTPPWWQRNPYG